MKIYGFWSGDKNGLLILYHRRSNNNRMTDDLSKECRRLDDSYLKWYRKHFNEVSTRLYQLKWTWLLILWKTEMFVKEENYLCRWFQQHSSSLRLIGWFNYFRKRMCLKKWAIFCRMLKKKKLKGRVIDYHELVLFWH